MTTPPRLAPDPGDYERPDPDDGAAYSDEPITARPALCHDCRREVDVTSPNATHHRVGGVVTTHKPARWGVIP